MGNDDTRIRHRVRFFPDEVAISAPEGSNLLDLAVENGVYIDAECGGAGLCGKCRVKLDGGFRRLATGDAENLPEDESLACQTEITGALDVTLPSASRIAARRALEVEHEAQNQPHSTTSAQRALASRFLPPPVVEKLHVTVSTPSEMSAGSDSFRLFSVLKKAIELRDDSMDFQLLRRVSRVLRAESGSVTVTVARDYSQTPASRHGSPSLLNLEPGDVSERFFAVAFDIGTTTIWAQLIDLRRQEVLAFAADYNDQIRFGADVINRIIACQKSGGVQSVQQAAVATMNRLLDELWQKSGIAAQDIAFAVAAGNSVMTHILLGIDPEYIRLTPHIISTQYLPPVEVRELGLNLPPHARLYTAPLVSAWMGGDLVAGVLALDLFRSDEMTLLIDLGTNGEIVLGNNGFLISTSCSSGPAFEGGGIKNGMRAMPGAIERFQLEKPEAEPMIVTIDRQPARGICGSGLISIVAELALSGVLLPNGKFDTSLGCSRLRQGDDGSEYVLIRKEHSAVGSDIVLTEVDIQNLLRAKSAIYAGIRVLLSEMEMDVFDLDRVLIAGGFGQSLKVANAVTIGLLPELPLSRFFFVGNSSLAGAQLMARSAAAMRESERIAGAMTYLDLGASGRFFEEFVAGTFIPHTNQADFPAVNRALKRDKP
ncbi:MAG: DUF4445 domain-containing protein [Deltaproteobacteria bacterium]|nr:DUF4445 domain-containing protein [Deltaproteobacteria bacterium]